MKMKMFKKCKFEIARTKYDNVDPQFQALCYDAKQQKMMVRFSSINVHRMMNPLACACIYSKISHIEVTPGKAAMSVAQEKAEERNTVDLLGEKYPFTSQQISLLLQLQILQGNDQYQLSSIVKEPAIQWVEENIMLQPFSDWIRHWHCDHSHSTDFFESMASLTGRKGSPTSELITIYNLTSTTTTTTDSEGVDGNATANATQLVHNMYRLGLACHCIQNWGDEDLNLNAVQKCAEMENHKTMIRSLETFKRESTSISTVENMNIAIARDDFLDWVELNFPQMQCLLSSYIHLSLFSSLSQYEDHDHDPRHEDAQEEGESDSDSDLQPCRLSLYALGNRTIFRFPSLEKLVLADTRPDFHSLSQRKIVASVSVESDLFHDPNVMGEGGMIGHFAFGLALMDPKLCGKWHRMYSTGTDGFAFLNLQRALTGYTGPTLMLIRPTEASMNKDGGDDDDDPTPGLLGFYTTNVWGESNAFYGTSDCFLFRAEPTWNLYRPRCFVQGWNFEGDNVSSTKDPFPPSRTKENFMYFNPSAGHINTGGRANGGNKVRGLALGGTDKDPRLHITESLESCVASSGVVDGTFESGPLLPGQWDKYFNVDVLEVWGVGGDDIVREAAMKKEEHESVSDATRRRVQTVDKKQFLQDFQSGMLLGNNELFKHRQDGNLRHDFGVDPDEKERPCT